MNEIPQELTLDVQEQHIEWESSYETFVYILLTKMNFHSWILGITLCSDDFIQNLNREYRQKDEPTDVLSFEANPYSGDDPEKNDILEGDLAISLNTVKTNADYFQVSFEEELKRVTVHGLMHLRGWDHETNESQEPMLLLQEKILKEVNGVRIF